jgi:hypothetical protein
MNRECEEQIEDALNSFISPEVKSLVVELLQLRRERWRDKLEKEENDQVRGKSLECKDLLDIFA